MAATDAIKQGETEGQPGRAERVARNTVILCVALAFVAVIWEREAELVAFACQISESVPPMTALGFLIGLVGLSVVAGAAARRLRPVSAAVAGVLDHLSMTGGQVMYVYVFTALATIVFSVGVIQTVLPEMVTLTYFADYSNDYAEAEPFVNNWLHVTDPEVARQYYEGADIPLQVPDMGHVPVISPISRLVAGAVARTQLVPWRYWVVPLAVWSVFLMLVFFTMQCVAGLAEREWTLAERLPYPLVEIPLGVTGKRSFVTGVPFLRDYVMWLGFAIGASYGLHEMIAATTFAFPQLGREYPLGNVLTEYPWKVIGGGINIFLMPEAYGLAYFASQDVLLTTALTWLGYLLFRVAWAAMGRQLPGTVYRNTSTGSFVGFVLAALWVARQPLRQALYGALGIPQRGDAAPGEGRSDRALPARQIWMMRGFLVGTALICGFLLWIGLPLHYVLFLVALFFIAAVGYARVRAVAGAATPWLWPHSSMTNGFMEMFGSEGLGRQGDYRPFAAMFHLKWMDRGYALSGMGTQLEGYNMSRRGGLEVGDMTRIMLLAIPVGLMLGWWMHLTAFYDHGANVLGGGTYAGGVRVRYANQDATWAIGLVNAPTMPDISSVISVAAGFLITVGGLIVRNINLRFPFHPAGFVIGMSDGRRFWAPFGIVWSIKALTLKLGGVSTYRRLMPMFLGIVIGHFFFTGIIMGLAKTTGLPVFENLPIIWF